jgi:hypothetical protein
MNNDADSFQRDKLIARQITNTLLHSFSPDDEFLLESGFDERQLAQVKAGLEQVNQRIMDTVKAERTPEVELEFALRLGALRNGQSASRRRAADGNGDGGDGGDDDDDYDEDLNDDDRIAVSVPLHRITGADLPKVWPNSARQATFEQLRTDLCNLDLELNEINAASALLRSTERQLASQPTAEHVDALAAQLKENNAKAAEIARLLKDGDPARLSRVAERAK